MSSPRFSGTPLQINGIGIFCRHIKGQGDVSLLGKPRTFVSYRTDQQARVDKPGQQQAQSQRHRVTFVPRTVVQVEPWLQVWVIDSPAVKDFTPHCVHSSSFTFAPPGHQKSQPRVKKQIYTQCTGLPLYLWEHYLNVPYMLVLNTHHRRAKQRLDFRAPGLCPSLSKATEKMMRTWIVGDDSRQLAALLPRDNLKPLDSSCQRLHISGEVKRLRKLKIDTGPTAALK